MRPLLHQSPTRIPTPVPKVEVPNWVRGDEELVMLSPREHTLRVIGLGQSVGTPNGQPVTAAAVVVDNWDELSLADCTGKIVVMNQVRCAVCHVARTLTLTLNFDMGTDQLSPIITLGQLRLSDRLAREAAI